MIKYDYFNFVNFSERLSTYYNDTYLLTWFRAVAHHSNPDSIFTRKVPRFLIAFTANHSRVTLTFIPRMRRGRHIRASRTWDVEYLVIPSGATKCNMSIYMPRCVSGSKPFLSRGSGKMELELTYEFHKS